MMMPVILWTDFLVFLLLAVLVIAFILGKNNVVARSLWLKVWHKPSRIVASIVLIVFMILGILDSLHFIGKDFVADAKMQSVLDVIMEPISTKTETSYSAPFATELFVKAMEKDSNGNIQWIAKPLQHVNPVPIVRCLFKGILIAMLICVTFSIALRFVISKRYPDYNFKNKHILTAWLTSCILVLLISCIASLIPNYHILGTDKIGVDVFYSSVKSIRTGLIIGILTTILTLPFAVLFGAMAGFYRGLVDDAIQYLYTTLSSIPGVLLIAAAMLSLESVIFRHANLFDNREKLADVRLLLLCAILGITSWTSLCRILRGETLKLREQGFVLASRVLGLNNMQIILRHIIPNLMHIILIALILDFSGLVLAEAVLSYVGVGVDATTYSWGNMINGARMEMGRDPVIWWSLFAAFIMMFTLVLAANIFADGVRDAFDPKSR